MGRLIYDYNPNAVEPPYEETYECPCCGQDIAPGTTLYFHDGECVGCEECITTRIAEDYFEEDN